LPASTVPIRDGFLKIPNPKEKIMRIRNLLLLSLFVPLYGCQQEAPAPKTEAPAAMEPAAAPAPAMAAPAMTAPAEPAAPAPAQAMEAAPAAMQPAPAPAPAGTAPAPAAAEAQPEAQAAPISDADFMQLAKKSNCLNCHTVDKKLVGPSFRDVAAKYRGDAGAEARMMDKIAKGGSGAWGPMMMPASPQVSEADRRNLAKYILSLK
jgi:cytochrome c